MRGRVFQRTKGRGKPWSYAVDLPPRGDGRRHQRLKGGFRTKAEAERALADLLVSIDQGTAVDPSRQTLGEYLDDWLAAASPSLRPSTAELYAAAIKNWIVPRIGGLPLQKVAPKHLQDLYTDLLKSGRVDGEGGLSPRSVRLAHQVLHLALERAADWRMIVRNPAAAKLDLPRMVRPPMRTWSADDAKCFLQSTASDRLGAVWALMVSTGLRRGEVLGLRWSDVDLELGRVSITQTVVVLANSAQLSEPKTAAGRRTVYLHSSLTEVLKRRKAEQAGERLLAGSAWEDHGLVFTTALGTPIHPRNLSRDFHLAVREAGVPSIRLHDLRHTAATLALTGGAHPKQVQEMLGHARVAITLDVYSHVSEQMHAEAADRIGRQLFDAEAPIS
jgi:integrase